MVVVKQQRLIQQHFHCSTESLDTSIPSLAASKTPQYKKPRWKTEVENTKGHEKQKWSGNKQLEKSQGSSRQLMSKHNYGRRPDNFNEVTGFSPFIWELRGWFSACFKASSWWTYSFPALSSKSKRTFPFWKTGLGYILGAAQFHFLLLKSIQTYKWIS